MKTSREHQDRDHRDYRHRAQRGGLALNARRVLAGTRDSSCGEVKRRYGERDIYRAERFLSTRGSSSQRGMISRRAE